MRSVENFVSCFCNIRREYKAYKHGWIRAKILMGGVWGRAPAAEGEEILSFKHILFGLEHFKQSIN